jgi:hypothetical protein
MTDILIQFHALPEELRPLIHWSMEELGVHITAFRFWPFQAVEVRLDTLDAPLLDPSIRELALTLEAPTLSIANMNAFLDLHPAALRLDIGRRSEKGLAESCLSCRTWDARSLEVWKKIARKLRGITKAGAIATNPDTGATARSRNHRYTVGAKALDDAGVPIMPVAGGNVLHFV